MPSRSEQILARSLRSILADLPPSADIPDSPAFQQALTALEFFIPQVLAELYPEWEHESLDGFYPLFARKPGHAEIEIFGLCIIISDQTVTPIHLRLQVAPAGDKISWLECRLGEAGEHGMIRTPWHKRDKALHALEGRADTINWVYKVTCGQKRP